MKNDVFVSNLPDQINDNNLKSLFSPYGKVINANVIIEKSTGKSKGYGFIRMFNEEDAIKAIEELNGKNIDGKAIRVEKSKDSPNKTRKINY